MSRSSRFISHSRARLQRRVVGHDEHFVEEARDRRLELRRLGVRVAVVGARRRPRRRSPCSRSSISSSSAHFGRLRQRRLRSAGAAERRERLGVELARDVAHALERRRQLPERLRLRRTPAAPRRFVLQVRDRHVAAARSWSRQHRADVAPIGAALLAARTPAARRGTSRDVGPDLRVGLERRSLWRALRRAADRSARGSRRPRAARRRAGSAARRAPAAAGRTDRAIRSAARPPGTGPTSVSSLSASETHAHVTRAAPERGRRTARPSASTPTGR